MSGTLQSAYSMTELFAPGVFVGAEIERMKTNDAAKRGAIFTRQEVVRFILDLVGYTVDRPLWQLRLLEPSFGLGDFLLSAIERLLSAASRDGIATQDLCAAIRAVELHRETFLVTRQRVLTLLASHGVGPEDASSLVDAWLVNDDFLLTSLDGDFDIIVGNPPYLRQEMIPSRLLMEYRRRYATLYDRADLYVPFIERSLLLLASLGTLGFICSDRWMKNRYGGPLREMVTSEYKLKYYVDMVGTDAFQSEVIAYPAITVIERGGSSQLRIAHRPVVSTEALSQLRDQLTGAKAGFDNVVTEVAFATEGSDPWLLEADAQPSLSLVRRLEAEFPTLIDAACHVGIGVATGADRVFIGPLDDLDVEADRKLPLVMTRDITNGSVKWGGLGIINPFEEDGSPADFGAYPKFAAFMRRHSSILKARHCAQRANGFWYRTIDRITPSLAHRPKLLIPDIKNGANIVLEDAGLYPHHNLYFITSKEWPLPALQAVLMTGIAHLFVRAYSTKMHGGHLRFQAQYLRRIRLPRWPDLADVDQHAILAAVAARDNDAALAVVCRIYRLSREDRVHILQAAK